jgi:ketosteroid isomerase-like protein
MSGPADPVQADRVRTRRRPVVALRVRAVAFLLAAASMGIPKMARSTTTTEDEIRVLDAREATAMLAADLPTLEQLWSSDFIVNAPDDEVKSRDQVLQAVRASRIRYSAFQRTVERIVVRGAYAISMGGEIVTPTGDRPDAGQSLSRRYTHVWHESGGVWSLVARHANVTRPRTP